MWVPSFYQLLMNIVIETGYSVVSSSSGFLFSSLGHLKRGCFKVVLVVQAQQLGRA